MMLQGTSRFLRRRRRLPIALVVSGLLVLALSASAAATGPDTSVSSGATRPSPGGDGATRINPDPTVTNLHRQAWDHIKVSADGKRLVVYFWMGVQDCNGLGRVDVSRQNGQLRIKLWTGTPAGAGDVACIEIAQLYKTVIHLQRPIITSGVG